MAEFNVLSLVLMVVPVSVLLYVVVTYFTRRNYEKQPPVYQGWMPWLGCALEFGRAPLTFIQQKHEELGPVFTLCVAGERYTFLMEAEDFDKFFNSPNVDFQKAVQDPTNRVASLPKSSFFKYHTKIHDEVKGKLAASQLALFSDHLCQSFRENLEKLAGGSDDLMEVVRSAMYPAVINNLFGQDVLPVAQKEEFDLLTKHFITFDDQFEYGAKLPAIFLKEWSTSKQFLLNMFQSVASKVQTHDANNSAQKETLLQIVCGIADKDCMANFSMLFLWASLANAIPITYWTLAFIMQDKDILNKAKQQVDSVLKSKTGVSESDLRQMPYLKCCMLEAIRLRSPGVITRRVVKSFTVKGRIVPAGDMLMLSPYWAHRNTRYFPQPEQFRPDRWEKADLDKNVFLPGFVAFGGGRYQCPGRWFALLEIHMFIALFLQRFDCQLIDLLPPPSPLHVVGTQQPSNSCRFQYSLRR
ncbi:24-hydroxycholesterol 7-alpha-hydroxylase-like isoform X1 [Haliotis cracherodii]|uniref:24-hydroxycholesterol 7-alpha-hydroxylase-like isoform X1 n=1 Tax=Haliotis cracherodii TaxID=6455 RepID=UPI0039E957C0